MTFVRMSRLLCFWGSSLVGLLAILPSEALSQPPQRETEKIEGIKRVVTNRKFEMTVAVASRNRAFCQSFLHDFLQQKNIEFVEPDARGDRYDDAIWQPYKSRCTNLASEPFDVYQCEPRIAQAIDQLPKGQRDSEYRSSCQHYRGTANFKHYLVDINNNPKDGTENVFYFERVEGPLNVPGAQRIVGNGGYSVIDLDRCELKGASRITDPYSYSDKRPLENYNGIIKYKGKYYIFDLSDLDRTLRLDGYSTYSDQVEPRLGTVCAFESERRK